MCQPRWQISISDHPKEIAAEWQKSPHKLDDFPIEIPINWMIFPLKYKFMDDFPIEIPIYGWFSHWNTNLWMIFQPRLMTPEGNESVESVGSAIFTRRTLEKTRNSAPTLAFSAIIDHNLAETLMLGENQLYPPVTSVLWKTYRALTLEMTMVQWEFQDPKMEVPTIYKAYIYIRPM